MLTRDKLKLGKGELAYMIPITLCTIWFRRPIQILAQLSLLGLRGDWMVVNEMGNAAENKLSEEIKSNLSYPS